MQWKKIKKKLHFTPCDFYFFQIHQTRSDRFHKSLQTPSSPRPPAPPLVVDEESKNVDDYLGSDDDDDDSHYH